MKHTPKLWSNSVQQRTSGLVLAAFVLVVGLGFPSISVAGEEESDPSSEAAMSLGSGLLTLVYLPVKVVYATLGGIVGGFTYALTGGDAETAQTVWEPSLYGTYVITPDHLRGDEPVRFYGASPYVEDEAYLTERVD